MKLKVHYDPAPGIHGLLLQSGEIGVGSYGLAPHNIAVDVGSEETYEIVSVEIVGALGYLPLGRHGYCAETDVLTLGSVIDNPDLISENGDLVGYWEKDSDPDIGMILAAVEIRNASKHLSGVVPD